MLDPTSSLALAERVTDTARGLGFESALISATALAVHCYTRGTEDIDLAVAIDPPRELGALDEVLVAAGLSTRLRLPDDDDPLGGVLTVCATVDGAGQPADVVEVVNFHNPGRIRSTPAPAAIARALALPHSPLRCATIEDLVALKLYAGGMMDHADIVQLLAHNPEADLDLVRLTAAPFDTSGQLDALIAQAAAVGMRRRKPRDKVTGQTGDVIRVLQERGHHARTGSGLVLPHHCKNGVRSCIATSPTALPPHPRAIRLIVA